MSQCREDIFANCAISQVLGTVGDKWSLVVLLRLSEHEQMRFMELRRAIPGVSQRMLTQTLRILEREGFISRTAIPTVPMTVSYALTELGTSFLLPMRSMIEWANATHGKIQEARRVFDNTNQ